jgi:hypothetical protein
MSYALSNKLAHNTEGADGIRRVNTDGITYYARITDPTYDDDVDTATEPKGDCAEKSMLCKLKLNKIGAVRKRGVMSKQFLTGRAFGEDFIHYWVEAKGLVYDISQGKQRITDIKTFYELYGVERVEEGKGTFGRFKEELTADFNKKELKKVDAMDFDTALSVGINVMELDKK